MLRGLGGYTKGFRRWDGFMARVFGGGGAFGVMGPPGGCSSTAGRRSKTSVTARLGACDYAVNGGPFSMDTGACLGHSVSAGVPVCPDCTVGRFCCRLRRWSGGTRRGCASAGLEGGRGGDERDGADIRLQHAVSEARLPEGRRNRAAHSAWAGRPRVLIVSR